MLISVERLQGHWSLIVLCVFVRLFVLRLNVPVNIFTSCRDGAIASWVLIVLSGRKVFWSRTSTVGFEPPTSRSGVRRSHRAPFVCFYFHYNFNVIIHTESNIYRMMVDQVSYKISQITLHWKIRYYWRTVSNIVEPSVVII